MADWMTRAQAQIEEMTPTEGFNVVAVDAMEEPGEALYLVGHFDDKGEAEEARESHEKASGDRSYVYEAKKKA